MFKNSRLIYKVTYYIKYAKTSWTFSRETYINNFFYEALDTLVVLVLAAWSRQPESAATAALTSFL